MARLQYLALAALVLSSAFVAPGIACVPAAAQLPAAAARLLVCLVSGPLSQQRLSLSLFHPGLAARQLKQNGGTIVFPGCSFLQDSEIARNQDYSDLYALLQATGLFDTLSNLQSPATLFAPTNQGIAEFLAAANTTLAEALADPSDATDVLLYHVVPQAILVCSTS